VHRFTAYDATEEGGRTDWIVDDNKSDVICYGLFNESKRKAQLIAFFKNCVTLGFRPQNYHW